MLMSAPSLMNRSKTVPLLSTGTGIGSGLGMGVDEVANASVKNLRNRSGSSDSSTSCGSFYDDQDAGEAIDEKEYKKEKEKQTQLEAQTLAQEKQAKLGRSSQSQSMAMGTSDKASGTSTCFFMSSEANGPGYNGFDGEVYDSQANSYLSTSTSSSSSHITSAQGKGNVIRLNYNGPTRLPQRLCYQVAPVRFRGPVNRILL